MIFDGHCDIWTDVTQKRMGGKKNIIKNYHLDKLRSGNVTGGVFVMWIDPPNDENPKKRLKEIIKNMSVEITENKDIIHIVKSYEDFEVAKKEEKFAVLIGAEGLEAIDDNIDELNTLYLLGLRHASLTWNEENKLAAGAPIDNSKGLTEEGSKVIKKMEELGIILDVSHTNEKTFWDICKIAKKPFIASHSNCKSLCDVARNLSDEQLREIARRNGVVGINAFKEFISKDENIRTVEGLVDHIDHMVNIMGIDHIGFGFDFSEYLDSDTLSHYVNSDGFGAKGIENATQINNVINILKQRGYSKEDIEKISYKNFYRIIKELI